MLGRYAQPTEFIAQDRGMINLYFIASYIQHSGDHLGKNPQYVYFNGSLVNFTGATLLLTLIFGLLGILICIFVSSVLHRMLINKAIKQYPKDKIIYKFQPSILTALPAEFFCGGFFGGYIIPLLLFSEIIHVDMVTRENLILYVIFGVAALTGCILLGSYTLILTNKKIIGMSYGGIIKNIMYTPEDIKAINKAFGGWEIVLKSGDILPLKCHPKAKKFYEKLKQLLKTKF